MGETWSQNERVNDVAIDPHFFGLGSTAGDRLGLAVSAKGTDPAVAWLRAGTPTLGEVFASLPEASESGSELRSAVLPSSRSVQRAHPASAFLTVINAGDTTAREVRLENGTSIPASFSYQATDANNLTTGTANMPVDIPAGAIQSFVFAFTPTAAFPPTDVAINVIGSNTKPSRTLIHLNTLLLSSSDAPVIDPVMVAGTATDDGTLVIPRAINGINSAAFVVATLNVGASGILTVTADVDGASAPLSLAVCQTDPVTSACFGTPTSSATTWMIEQSTATFGIFATATGPIVFDPAKTRIVVRAVDERGVQRGGTTIAVRTE